MSSINKVFLIGHLGDDPEVRHTAAGEAVSTMRLATSDRSRDKVTGEQREQAQWHRVVMYRRLAELARDHLKKGAQVYVEGRIRTRKWQDRSGEARYVTEVEALQLQMLGDREASPRIDVERLPTPPEAEARVGARPSAGIQSPWSDEDPPF